MLHPALPPPERLGITDLFTVSIVLAFPGHMCS